MHQNGNIRFLFVNLKNLNSGREPVSRRIGKILQLCFLLAAVLLSDGTTMMAQESIEAITVRDITPKKGILESLKGELSVAPYYSAEMGAGSALIYTCPNNLSFIGNVTTKGYLLTGIAGSTPLAGGRSTLEYSTAYSHLPSWFWGTGFGNGSNNGNKREYDRDRFYAKAKMLYSLGKGFYAGGIAGYEWNSCTSSPISNALLYGATLAYDTRDNRHRPAGGIYAVVTQENWADFCGKPFFKSTLQIKGYRKLWETAVVAAEVFGEFSYGNTPWYMMPTVGGIERLRGYYKGRYTDRNLIGGQMEVRQQIVGNLSGTVWVAGANLWSREHKFALRNSLPNAGAGVRWKTGANTVMRLDYGVGRGGQNAFILAINEAF